MADLDSPPEPIIRDDRRRDRVAERKERPLEERRRDRDPRERRDDRTMRDEREDRPMRRDYYERRSVDDERPGNGLTTDRRDRERDYKRRKSPSPPSYGHRDRDRRYSPSRRSPPHKRSRREDDYDLGRRGNSPRSGVMPSDGYGYDRRYGYEGLGPSDRIGAGGGRSNSYSGDERAYGRHSGSRSDWPDSGRGGYSDVHYSSLDGAPRQEGLMTYKQFISELEDDISPAEAERRYEEYKNEFISTQKNTFFEQNKHEDWLREKYDPSCLEAVIERRNESCKASAREFFMELEAGTLDMSSCVVGKSMRNGLHASDEEATDISRRRRNGRRPAKEQESDVVPKAPEVSSEPRRVTKDIEQARALVRKLDSEKGIERNILVSSDIDKSEGERTLSGGSMNPIVIVRGANQVKGYEGLELLDVVLTYLWQIHYVDYYGCIEYKEPPKVLRHVRTEGKGTEDTAYSTEWEKKLDASWQDRLQGQDLLERMLGTEKIELSTNEALDPYVRKIKDEKYGWKYGCGAKGCTKLFHGPEFVHKHLKLKHSELVYELVLKIREDLYFQNYMSDPDAPGSSPTMAPQRDRSHRSHRAGTVRAGSGGSDEPRSARISSSYPLSASGRGSRDADRGDRGSIREHEKYERARDDDRHDRENEPSPSHEFQGHYDVAGSAGPFEGGRSDAAMFDPFNAPMRAPPPFGTDIGLPPPVLMPVPGAGPLGPFVPAPPEVAMRLWREQPGAGHFHPGAYDGPFDGESSAARGSRKRSGPSSGSMIGASPMILPLPSFRQNSRRALRSYRDLDAPEDEVTVIDYRSL